MKSKPRFLFLTLVIVLVLFIGGLILDKNHQTAASNLLSNEISLGVDQSQEVVIKFYYDTQEQLNAVAGQLDVWEVHPLPGLSSGAGYAVAAVFPSQKDWLEVQGYRVELDQVKTAELLAPNAALDPRYYYFDDFNENDNDLYMVDFMQSMNAAYPTLTELIDIGDAWLSMHDGYHRDMWVLRISNEDPQYGEIASKPPFFLMANIHAREVSTPEMAIRYIKYLTSGYRDQGGYGIDPDVTWLVNHHVVYVLVSQNPDGHVVDEIDWTDYWRKNVDDDDGCGDPSSVGVDLNRNSSFKWGCCGGSDPNPCGETYRGPERASEPETSALQIFALQVFGDWNGDNGDDEFPPAAPDDTRGIFISLHAYQDEILWAYECAPDCGNPPNGAQLTTIGRKLAQMAGPYMNPTGFLYTVDGGSIDWMYGKLGIPAYTYEIGPTYGACADFFPPYGCQDGEDGMPRDFWVEMKPSFIYANKIAGSPYLTAYGPDTEELIVNPSSVPMNQPFDLSGTILDQRYGSDPLVPIAGAEYFIDAPGEDGTGIAMSPSDGSFDDDTEAVEAVVDTTGLPSGQHYLLVHGQNENGYWGPFTGVFFEILPEYAVVLTPETATSRSEPGTTVTYQMQVQNVGLHDDSFNISVAGAWSYDAPPAIGPIPPSETASFDLLVTIPPDAIDGDIDTAIVTATSQIDEEANDSSTLITTAIEPRPIITPTIAQGSGDPGTSVSYTLQLTNHNYVTDTFTLSAESSWLIDYPATVGPLPADGITDVTVLVTIPEDAAGGASDVATLTFTSSNPDLPSATTTLTTSAKNIFTFQAQAQQATLIAYGRDVDVDYTILVTNTGNISDTYDVFVTDNKWTVDAPQVVGPLGRNLTEMVTITVHVPIDVVIGDFDEFTVAFISRGSGSGHTVLLRTETFLYNTFLPLSIRQ